MHNDTVKVCILLVPTLTGGTYRSRTRRGSTHTDKAYIRIAGALVLTLTRRTYVSHAHSYSR